MKDLLGCCYGDCGLGAEAPSASAGVVKGELGDRYIKRADGTIEFLEPEVISISRPANTSAWVLAAAAIGGTALLLGGRGKQRRQRAAAPRR